MNDIMIFLSSAYSKFKKKDFLYSTFIYGLSNGLSAVSPFLILPILTSVLTREEFGKYSNFLFLVGVLTVLIGLNIHGSVSVNFFKLSKDRFAQFVSNCLFVTILSFILCSIIVGLIAPNISSYLKVNDDMVNIATLVGFFNALFISCLSILQASGKPLGFLKLKFFQIMVDVFLTIALVVLFTLGMNGRLTAYSTAIVGASILSIFFIFRLGFFKLSIKKKYAAKALAFGVPLLPHAISGMMIMYIDRIVITKLIGVGATGVFMAGLQVAMIMLLFIEPINKAFKPWLYNKLSSENCSFKPKLVKATYFYFFLLLLLALLLYFINDYIFLVLLDSKFYEAKELMIYLYLGFSFQGMYYAVTNYVFFVEKTGSLSMVSISTIIIGVFLSYILVGSLGLIGAAISFMITNFLLFIGVWFLASRKFSMPWFSVLLRW